MPATLTKYQFLNKAQLLSPGRCKGDDTTQEFECGRMHRFVQEDKATQFACTHSRVLFNLECERRCSDAVICHSTAHPHVQGECCAVEEGVIQQHASVDV